VRSLIKLNATITSRLPAGTSWLTAKRYKVFAIRVEYRFIKTITSTYLFYSTSCRKLGSDTQLYQWTHCIMKEQNRMLTCPEIMWRATSSLAPFHCNLIAYLKTKLWSFLIRCFGRKSQNDFARFYWWYRLLLWCLECCLHVLVYCTNFRDVLLVF
jgi:hypothetical protein